MSLFGSLMGDLEEDPFFGAHMRSMRQMNNMMNSMNSMFANPFGMMGAMGPPAIAAPHMGGAMPAIGMGGRQDLMPFGFPNMNRMYPGVVDHMGNDPNCHSYSSSSVMTMSSGPDGRPQVYQASSSTRTAPGGVKETKKTVCDSRAGVKKLAIGHHIGDRAHVLEKEQNLSSGDLEERQEYINLEEEEAEDFNREFEQRTRQQGAIGPATSSRHARRYRDTPLAITSPGSGPLRSRSFNPSAQSRRSYPALTTSSSTNSTSPHHEKSRKRDHEPDETRKHKSMKPSHETTI